MGSGRGGMGGTCDCDNKIVIMNNSFINSSDQFMCVSETSELLLGSDRLSIP